MRKSTVSNESASNREFAVRAEVISRYFSPPLASSTFYDLVKKGKIVRFKGLRGFFKLNESLRRLGLQEETELPEWKASAHSTEDIIRLAFNAMDSQLFPGPTWLLDAETLDERDFSHASMIFQRYVAAVEALQSDREKIGYFQGVLDAAYLQEKDRSTE